MKGNRPNFEEEFAGLVYDIFRHGGVTIHQNNQEAIRNVTKRMSKAILDESRRSSVEVFKRLQGATLKGFKNFEESFSKLEEEVKELRKENVRLQRQIEILQNSGQADHIRNRGD